MQMTGLYLIVKLMCERLMLVLTEGTGLVLTRLQSAGRD